MIKTTKKIAIGQELPLKKVTADWFDTYTELVKESNYHVLLESGRGGRYSFIGLSPWAILKGKGKELSIETKDGIERLQGPLLPSLRSWLKGNEVEKNDQLPDFQCGIIGQFSYDLIREIEKIPSLSKDDLNTYDLFFLAFDDITVIDHQKETIWFITAIEQGKEKEGYIHLKELEQKWEKGNRENSNWYFHKGKVERNNLTPSERSFTEEGFMNAVKKTQEYISAGDVFQVNLSVRESSPLHSHPLHVYSCLRKINPSPYMGYFHTPEVQYVSASPELLVKVKGDEVSTRPIAGTRSRGKDEKEDQELANTLINNEKERAEHVMLVDLERNDLGRVCEYGSVEVNELMVIEKYSHVMHIVSNVRGKKSEKYDTLDVIAATFPGGTITGAPKIRTMEIIEELEAVRRGVYTGSMGWIGFDGDMELNITIRTMIALDGIAHVQAGAGIVIDSDPKAEFKESLKKAKALWKAKEMSEEEISKNVSMS
ncbi:anthranilate synthase component I family protein [Evansella sp. AB-P1]|uniref:anthranilate synthase component I family protein n=1 Tax=Evansella sp. AB-P1 TaxID=3037653 RepID=UPI00241FEB40|nr:anthranilate synthase component I family protein [Evansella sp. AB-P1]MDG5790174.1 anthranilate synthase component I family protein [Evansella sp. AB-P1]